MLELKTVFLIAVTTARMIFPGIPAGPKNEATASRSISFELMSSAKAPAKSTASVWVPEGLKLGESVKLLIEQEPAAAPAEPADEPGGEVATMSSKSYWGCGDAVLEGQPRVGASLPPQPGGAASYPEGSYAYWPGPMDKPLKEDASAVGSYKLVTDYAGNTSVDAAPGQEFLAPVELVGLPDKPDFAKPLKVQWKPVPNALAYLVTASGGSEKESVDWTSSKDPNPAADFQFHGVSGDGLKDALEKGLLLPADATTCTVPSGIFKAANIVMLTVTAIGKDSEQTKGGTRTQVTVRSTATVAFVAAGPDATIPPPPP